MTVRLQLVPISTHLPGRSWALAWYRDGVVTIRRPFHRIFFALQRAAHELGHHDGEPHHSAVELCTMSPIALRFGWSHATRTKEQVRAFLATGVLD